MQAEEALQELSLSARAWAAGVSEEAGKQELVMYLSVLASSVSDGAATLESARRDVALQHTAAGKGGTLAPQPSDALATPLLGRLNMRNLSSKTSLSSLSSVSSPRLAAGCQSGLSSPCTSEVRHAPKHCRAQFACMCADCNAFWTGLRCTLCRVRDCSRMRDKQCEWAPSAAPCNGAMVCNRLLCLTLQLVLQSLPNSACESPRLLIEMASAEECPAAAPVKVSPAPHIVRN